LTDFSKYKVSKNIIYRRALIVSKKGAEIIDKERRIEDKITAQLSSITGLIYSAIDNLWKYTKARPPWVNYLPDVSNTDDTELIPIIETEGKDTGYYRALVALKDIKDDKPNSSFLKEKDISHLIEINLQEPYGWKGSKGVACAIVNTSLDKIPLLITDMALDIAMFYTKMAFERFGELTIKDKIAFFESKAEFAINNKCNTYYGPILD
jgi:hypothetical protein